MKANETPMTARNGIGAPKAKIVVQHTATSFYFQGKNRWTLRGEDAFGFESIQTAQQFCNLRGNARLQPVLVFRKRRRKRTMIGGARRSIRTAHAYAAARP